MAIIDSRSDAKFDALIRTNKDDALISFIMATSKTKDEDDRKLLIANRLKSAYELFRDNTNRNSSGAGSYGDGTRDIAKQFSSHYTMGYEMGIWEDSDLHLNSLADKVSKYELTVSQYIGIVFLNLFSYYKKNGLDTYHHFLYEILKKAESTDGIGMGITKSMILETLPIEKAKEQGNIIFNYLAASDIFNKIDKETICISDEWKSRKSELLSLCNLEYEDLPFDKAVKIFSDKKFYADYVTKCPKKSEVIEVNGTSSVFNLNYDIECNKLPYTIQRIYFGAPGTGKSFAVDNFIRECYPNVKNSENAFIFKTTIYADYSYYNFIGSIMPVSNDGSIKYDFEAGIFTKALATALKYEDKDIFLVVEELSRGNIASIFGDIFLLLDRDENGESEYFINNDLISQYLKKNNIKSWDKIVLPRNFHIIGTVNTSDQNVNVIDTAFKRRFEFIYIDVDAARNQDNELLNTFEFTLDDKTFEWNQLFMALNSLITTKLELSEDKQIGQFFIKFNSNKNENIKFSELQNKLLHYLWEDVQGATFSNERIFKDKYKTFSSLYKDFGEHVNIFSEDFNNIYDKQVL